MYVEVGRVNRKNKQIIQDAANFYSKELISPRKARNLYVVISHCEELVNDNMDGFCEWIEENVNPREFAISINCKRSIDEVLISLAHEMVHVSQFVSNKLKHRIKGGYRFIWEGEVIDRDKYNYFDLPWEIEAYGLENDLYQKFMATKSP